MISRSARHRLVDGRDARRAAFEDPNCAHAVVVGRTRRKIGEPIAVDVAGGRDGRAIRHARGTALIGPGRRRRHGSRCPVVQCDAAFGGLTIAETGSAHEHIAVTVVVDVTNARHGRAQSDAGDVAFDAPERRRCEAGCASEIDLREAFLALTIRVISGADDQVRIAVAVHVSGRGHRATELLPGLCSHDSPVRAPVWPGGTAVVDVDAAGFAERASVGHGGDGEVTVSVAVHVADRDGIVAK